MFRRTHLSCVLVFLIILTITSVEAKKLTVDTSTPCGGMSVVDANPVELLPILGEGSGWLIDWTATCLDMGGQKMMGVLIPRSRVLAARYVKGQDAVAVTLTINQDEEQSSGSALNMSPEAAQYSMVKPISSKKITFADKEAFAGVLGGMGEYRQDVLDVMLSPHAVLNIQREYTSAGKPMDMVQWAKDVLKVEAYEDPDWVKAD
ncbi:MAG: hypothetical protein EOM25_05850 [Deltaproteobacteria bacterium]|nr:hypothetical protein [Deltaproteobacteria bacterium]